VLASRTQHRAYCGAASAPAWWVSPSSLKGHCQVHTERPRDRETEGDHARPGVPPYFLSAARVLASKSPMHSVMTPYAASIASASLAEIAAPKTLACSLQTIWPTQ